MNSPLLIEMGIVAATASTLVATLFYMLQRKEQRARYDEFNRRVEIEEIRKSLEERIYKLNAEVTANLERWKDTNHLLLSAQKANQDAISDTGTVPDLELLRRIGLEPEDHRIDPTLAFVLIPFHSNFQPLFHSIQQACHDVGLRCIRGDEEHIRGDIFSHVLRQIVKARLIIAVLDGRNPNVYYELGIAQAMNKSILVVSQSGLDSESIPFDIRTNRILFYKDLTDLRFRLTTDLARAFVSESK